ncbi:MAG: SprB repeat-containing protein, partial [Bacteroidetes bacterium]|nr:SprB repeat-containing protein [Bacteroidota bacterium]
MKTQKHFLLVLSAFLFSHFCFAQPANNNCANAQPITIGTVPPCGTGIQTSANTNVAGTLTGATPGNPYIYQTGCTGSSTVQTSPANDVWYTFVATGYHANITVNSTFSQPNISMYSGTCGSLGGGVGGCAVGAGGVATLQVDQLIPGNTYYIQISGGTGQTGTFNLTINNSIDCAGCLQGTTLSVNPLPVNGAYPPNTTVQFCFHINQYNHVNTNWLHGVQLSLGSGWNAASVVPNNPVSPSTGGSWQWVSTSYVANGQTWPPGWYWETAMPTLNPANNFGDPATTANASQWNFCINVTTKPTCIPGSNLSVDFNTSGDGESGSWINSACSGDAATSFNAIGACCAPVMSMLPVDCFGTLTGDATATPVGTQGPYTYNWSGPAGFSASSTGVAGANTINNVAAGVYTVQIIDKNLCAITNTVLVTEPPLLVVNVTPANANCTTAGSISSGVSGGTPAYSFSWSGPSGFTSTSANVSNLTNAGTYVLTVTDSKGCVKTQSATITQAATVTAGFTGATTDCLLGNTFTFNNTGSTGAGVTYAYTFNPTAGAPATGNTASYGPVSFTAPGTYTVKETVTQGICTATAAAVVIVNPDPSATLSFTNATCGFNNGIIFINNTSTGQTISSFASSAGVLSGQTVTGLGAGTPIITLTNNFGCTFTVSTPITNTPPITALATTFVNPTCGNNNGSITLGTVTGGTPTYSYSINGGLFTTTPVLTG